MTVPNAPPVLPAHKHSLPDVSGDPLAIVVQSGEVRELTGDVTVSTIVVQEGGVLRTNGCNITIIDQAPTPHANPDLNQLDVGIVVAGDWEGDGFTVQSANPAGHRGHVLITGHANVNLRNFKLYDLGRTTTDPLDEQTNKIGRYAIHFHHCWGKFLLEDFEIHRSPKWGLAIHSSHHGQIRRGVIRDCEGAGLVFEGYEAGNVVEDIDIAGSHGNGLLPTARGNAGTTTDFGFEGAGLWMRFVGNNVVHRIKVRDSRFGAVVQVPKGPVAARLPSIQGADPAGASGYSVQVRDASLWNAIDGLDVDDVEFGLETWEIDKQPAALLKDSTLKARSVACAGRFTRRPTFEGVTFDAPLGFAQQGFDPPGAYMEFARFRDCRFVGEKGMAVRPSNGLEVVGCTFDCADGIKLYRRHDSPLDVVLAGNIHAGNLLNVLPLDIPDMRRPPEPESLLMPLRVLLTTATGSYRLYRPEQLADFVPPESSGALGGSPEPGLTNDQLQAKYGLSTLGYVAPCAETLSGVLGMLACPTDETELGPRPALAKNASAAREGSSLRYRFVTTTPCRPLLAMINFGVDTTDCQQVDGPLATSHDVLIPNRPGRSNVILFVKDASGTIGELGLGVVKAAEPPDDNAAEIALLEAEQKLLTAERDERMARVAAIDKRQAEIAARLAELREGTEAEP